MNIYSIQNVDGDCEGMQVAESPEMALAKYREWTCLEDEEYEATTAVACFDEETGHLSDAEKEAWLEGYSFACEKFAP